MKEEVAIFTGVLLSVSWLICILAFIFNGFNIELTRALTMVIPLTILWFKYGKKEAI